MPHLPRHLPCIGSDLGEREGGDYDIGISDVDELVPDISRMVPTTEKTGVRSRQWVIGESGLTELKKSKGARE